MPNRVRRHPISGNFPLNPRLYTLRRRPSGQAVSPSGLALRLALERLPNIGSVLLERRLGTRSTKRKHCFAQRTPGSPRKLSGSWGFGSGGVDGDGVFAEAGDLVDVFEADDGEGGGGESMFAGVQGGAGLGLGGRGPA